MHAGSITHIFGDDHPEENLDFTEMVTGDFWGDRIHTVAAIVGNNGSGKTTMLNGIKNGGIDVDFERVTGLPRGNNLAIFYSPFLEDSYKNERPSFNSIDISRYYQI